MINNAKLLTKTEFLEIAGQTIATHPLLLEAPAMVSALLTMACVAVCGTITEQIFDTETETETVKKA